MKEIIASIEKRFKLEEKPAGEFSSLKVGPMKFFTRHWNGGLLGNVSIMEATGMMGLMRMETLVINPVRIDMPLLSLDLVVAMGKVTMIAELYGTTVRDFDQKDMLKVKESLSSLSDRPAVKAWYDDIRLGCSVGKQGRKKDLAAIEKGFSDFIGAYLEAAAGCREITEKTELEKKRACADAYINGLLEHGGPSTDVFVKKLGREKTADFFHKVLFG